MGLEAKISANIDDFQKNLDKAQKAATEFSEKASKSFEKLGQSIQKLALPAAAASLALSAIGLSAVKTFAELEGVKAAFDRLNDPNLLNDLRKATKGTTSDFELMKNAVQASNFKLPVEQLASLMEFASRRAKDTGESVDYLVNSIVTGIGRKSPLILDNLGISATELKKQLNGVSMEAASIADVTEAVGRIASAELLKMGKDSDTLAEKFLRIKTIFTNEMGGMGETISKALSPAINAIENLALKFQALSPEMKNMIVYVGAGIAAFAGLVAAAGAIITIAPLVAAAWAAIGGPIALIATGVAVAAALIISNWDKVTVAVRTFAADLLKNIGTVLGGMASLANAVGANNVYALLSAAQMGVVKTSERITKALSDEKIALFDKSNAEYAAISTSKALADEQAKLSVSVDKVAEATKRSTKNFWALKGVIALNGKEFKPKKVQEKNLKTLDRDVSFAMPTPNITGIRSEMDVQVEMLSDMFNDMFGKILPDDTADAIAEKVEALQNRISGSISGFASSVGSAIANGGNIIEAFGKGLLSSFGDFLSDFGKKLVAYGLAAGAFAKLQLAMTNPITAIPAAGLAVAAGIALQIAGAAAKSAAIMGNSSSSGSGGGYSNSAVRMSDPSTLYKSAPMEIKVSGEFVQRGSDLYAVVERETSRNNRIR